MKTTRREFLKQAGAGVALSLGGVLPGFSAAGYHRIMGANERINVSIIGVNSRGNALAHNFARQEICNVSYICDVDKEAIAGCLKNIQPVQDRPPVGEQDFRKSLESKEVDAVAIAAPDHWHAPMALLALQAGKHVYLEKPVSHNPREGEMLIEATAKYGKVVQVGTQRRSWPKVIEAIRFVHDGGIGNVHFGRGWYANNRPGIGTGKVVPVPDHLNWDLWQGPAPRKAYKDNIVHYNWHWFWHWGTAETLNNGTHMIDLLCWGMNLRFPTKVSSFGGRYYYQDDWETPDTQTVSFEFGDKAGMLWEGHSCNSKLTENNAVGVIFYGDLGSVFIGGGDGYTVFDKQNKIIKEVKSEVTIDPQNKVSPAQHLDAIHILNFFDAITKGTPLFMKIEDGHCCTLLMQLANISLRTGRMLRTNPANGHIIDDNDAMQYWTRTYEPGWEPRV
jgi:predicted dehydrogenase